MADRSVVKSTSAAVVLRWMNEVVMPSGEWAATVLRIVHEKDPGAIPEGTDSTSIPDDRAVICPDPTRTSGPISRRRQPTRRQQPPD